MNSRILKLSSCLYIYDTSNGEFTAVPNTFSLMATGSTAPVTATEMYCG